MCVRVRLLRRMRPAGERKEATCGDEKICGKGKKAVRTALCASPPASLTLPAGRKLTHRGLGSPASAPRRAYFEIVHVNAG
jgi:hypothetical protein